MDHRRRTLRSLCASLLLLLSLETALYAQSDTGGSIAGLVKDAGGRLFPALITLRNTANGSESQMLSDRKGNFRFAELAPGIYSVRINAPGFAPWRATNVTVEVGRVTSLTAQLSLVITEPRQRLKIRSTQLNPSPAVSDNIDHEAVESLPSSSGDWSAAALLSAGTAPSSSDSGDLSFRGLSPLLNSVSMDGVDDNLAFHARQRGTAGGGYSTAQSAISEFQVNASNFSSEYGHAAGGVINTVTKSGSNHLHGDAAFYDRSADWGAGNAFTSLTEKNAEGVYTSVPYRPTDLRRQWSASAGGPLRKDKLFWFAAYDQHQRNFPGVARANVPATFFAPPSAQTIATLAGRIGQQPSAALLAYNNVLGQLNGLLGSVPRSIDQWIAFAKIDWRINNRNSLTFQNNSMRRNGSNAAITQSSDTYGIGSFGDTDSSTDTAVMRWQYFATPNLLSDARYQYSREDLAQHASQATAFEAQLAKNAYGLPPQVVVDPGSGFTLGTRTSSDKPAYPDETRQQFIDAVTWIHHRHAIKFGYDYNHVDDAISGLNAQTGAYSYSSLLNFVSDFLAPNHCDGTTTGAGSYPCYSHFKQAVGSSVWDFQTEDYAAFLADEWKITPRFMVSVGARYEYQDLPNTNKLVANPAIPQTATLPHDKSNYGPRAGIAWDIFDSGRTVIHAGYGLYYGRVPNATVFSALTSTGSARSANSYYFRPLAIGAPPFPYVFSGSLPIAVQPDVVYFDKHFRNPQVEQAELSLQQSLGKNTYLTLTYLGSYSHELSNFIDTNIDLTATGLINYSIDDPSHAGPIKTSSYSSKFFYKRISPTYNSITDIVSETNAKYGAAVAKLTRRVSSSLNMNLGYTYSHAVDDNQNQSTFADNNDVYDPTNLALEHGTSNFDVRQRFSGQMILHEPWRFKGFAGRVLDGYTLAASGEWRTGLPYTMRTSGSIPALACSYQQYLQSGQDCASINDPGVIPGTAVSISGLGESLNGSGGDNLIPLVGRNTFRYPSVENLDVRAAKRTAINDRVSFEVMVEAFNALNHENVTSVQTLGYLIDNDSAQTNAARLTYLSGSNGTAAFGGITNANNTAAYRQRQLQAGCKIRF
jgi:hypothetical protein